MYLHKETKVVLEKFIGKSILEPVFSKKPDVRIQGRGNPLMSRKRICTMEEIDKRIMEM